MPNPLTLQPRAWLTSSHGHLAGIGLDDTVAAPSLSPVKPRRVNSLFGRLSPPGAVPYISQLGQGHWNDESNCGPTCMAMAGRAYGIVPPSSTDLSAIDAAGRVGGTRGSGTTAYGLARIADVMGIDFQQVHGVSPPRISGWLDQGALVVIRGNAWAMPWRQDDSKYSGHVVLVVGKDDSGNFLVNDPYDDAKKTRSMSAEELVRFGAPRDFRDKSFSMAVGRMSGPTYCREVLPGVPRV